MTVCRLVKERKGANTFAVNVSCDQKELSS